jgi:DNA-nicking Smr family endonuclease
MAENAMSRRKPQLSDEELALWAHVAASVKPLPGRKPLVPKPAPAPAAEVRPVGVFASLDAAPPPRPALQPLAQMERRMRQRVSRGRAPIDGVIDLHGMRQDEAHRALVAFIRRKQHEGAAVVIIVTGKGDPDPDKGRGVLKRMVPHWLADPGLRNAVIGYEEAGLRHGGGGALYVRIRRQRENG